MSKSTEEWNTDREFEKIELFLESIPQYRELTGKERSEHMLKKLGNPEKGMKIIHVAGTNGKGSVCAYLNSILCAHGYKTGLFTSPHLIDIRERIQVNGKWIEKADFNVLFEQVQKAADWLKKNGIELAYFDYFLGIAMLAFAKEKVDFVVMETGLGGRLDSTNAVSQPVLSVITSISLEHMSILGDTVEKIAAEKAGIIKDRIPVVYFAKTAEISQVIEDVGIAHHAQVTAVSKNEYQIQKNTGKYIDFSVHNGYYKNDCFTIATGAVYQVENCAIALTAAGILLNSGVADLKLEKIQAAVLQTHWEGRMEEVLKDVYIDGAHNPDGVEAFIQSAEQICRGRKCILLFSVVKDKNFENMIQRLCACELFESFIITQLDGKRQLGGETIQQIFCKYTTVPVYEFDRVEEAFAFGLDRKEELFMCTGSLYLIGEIKSMISGMTAAE
jgi:dihydrofolate synthase/folylpolyglutamate synthase